MCGGMLYWLLLLSFAVCGLALPTCLSKECKPSDLANGVWTQDGSSFEPQNLRCRIAHATEFCAIASTLPSQGNLTRILMVGDSITHGQLNVLMSQFEGRAKGVYVMTHHGVKYTGHAPRSRLCVKDKASGPNVEVCEPLPTHGRWSCWLEGSVRTWCHMLQSILRSGSVGIL